MIKRIIFDLDNTLIPFPKDFEKCFKKIIDKYDTIEKISDLKEML